MLDATSNGVKELNLSMQGFVRLALSVWLCIFSVLAPTDAAAASADLTVTKSHVGNFARGQLGAAYTITVTNVGAGTSDGTVSLTDTLPVGLTLTPGPNSFGGAGWLCFFGSLTCTRLATDTLAPAASYPPITLLVDVSSNASASLINTVTISGGGDTNAANNTANDATLIAGPPAFSGAASRRAHGGAGTFDLPLAP